MKKVLVAGAALMLVSGYASTVLAADSLDTDLLAVHYPDTEKAAAVTPPPPPPVKPGVVITGDARARFAFFDDNHLRNSIFGNRDDRDDSELNFDSRVRINFTGTSAGGSYVKARIRMMETFMSDNDVDPTAIEGQNNLWADLAYFGIPFNDKFTMEIGKYRSTYGPLAATYNFFYDDVHLAGARGIIKMGDCEINPFIEWMEEAQIDSATGTENRDDDNDEIRFGVHAKAKINKDWTVGGMVGFQMDDRNEITTDTFEPNEGFFASIYGKGKSGVFGFAGELAVTDADLNNFNSWEEDSVTSTSPNDRIGSDDTGFGGYVFPNYQIDKLNIGLNLGFTTGGFQPDRAFGFVMIGSADNSQISTVRLGDTGDWLWAGLVAEYSISESLKLTGNLVYADIDGWDEPGDGPNVTSGGLRSTSGISGLALKNAWELSAVLQYTISKGADVYFSAGYLQPELEDVNGSDVNDDGTLGALTRFELKF